MYNVRMQYIGVMSAESKWSWLHKRVIIQFGFA